MAYWCTVRHGLVPSDLLEARFQRAGESVRGGVLRVGRRTTCGIPRVYGVGVGVKRDRVVESATVQLMAWWQQMNEPMPMTVFTRRWCRAAQGAGFGWPDFVSACEASGGVVIVWRASGARVVFPGEAWRGLPDAVRFHWEWGREGRRRAEPVEPSPELEAFTERWRAHTEPSDTVVPFFRRSPKS